MILKMSRTEFRDRFGSSPESYIKLQKTITIEGRTYSVRNAGADSIILETDGIANAVSVPKEPVKDFSKNRVCLVNGDRAIFHRWTEVCELRLPGLMIGSGQGGQLKDTFALVEFEDGTIKRVRPEEIRFLDTEQVVREYMDVNDIWKWAAYMQAGAAGRRKAK